MMQVNELYTYIISFASHTRIVPSEDPVNNFSSTHAKQLIALSWPTYCRLRAADFASYALAIPSPHPVNTWVIQKDIVQLEICAE